jgi:hypothetical protein
MKLFGRLDYTTSGIAINDENQSLRRRYTMLLDVHDMSSTPNARSVTFKMFKIEVILFVNEKYEVNALSVIYTVTKYCSTTKAGDKFR